MKYYFVTLDGSVVFASTKAELATKIAEYRASI